MVELNSEESVTSNDTSDTKLDHSHPEITSVTISIKPTVTEIPSIAQPTKAAAVFHTGETFK